MNTILIEELVNSLSKEEFNIVGFIVTPWHLLGMRSFIEYLKSIGEYRNHIIIIGPHVTTGYVFDINNLPDDCYIIEDNKKLKLDISFLKKMQLFWSSQNSNLQDPVYIVNSWNYRLETTIYLRNFLNRKFRLAVIDEGVATYMNTSNRLYLSMHNKDIKGLVRLFGSAVMHRMLRNNINANLLINKEGCLQPNDLIVPFYKKVLGVEEYVTTSSKTILIATMAFAEDQIYNNELVVKIKQLADFLHDHGYDCKIKPHPREKNVEKKYSPVSCEIVGGDISMEEYLVKEKPTALISFSSTCLITADIFYGVKAISMTNLLDINNFSQIYQNELTTFKNTFEGNVYYPKSHEELLTFLNKERSHGIS